jgi:hypothetical protein
MSQEATKKCVAFDTAWRNIEFAILRYDLDLGDGSRESMEIIANLLVDIEKRAARRRLTGEGGTGAGCRVARPPPSCSRSSISELSGEDGVPIKELKRRLPRR